MKYQSELIKEIVETRGHEKSSLHYESECVEAWIKEAKGGYPKLCDYESEWLNYISTLDDTGGGEDPEPPIGEFPYETITDVTEATIDNVVPYAYKSAVLKGQSLVNLLDQFSHGCSYDSETGIYTSSQNEWVEPVKTTQNVKVNVPYTLIAKVNTTSDYIYIRLDYNEEGVAKDSIINGRVTPNSDIFIKTTVVFSKEDGIRFVLRDAHDGVVKMSNIMLIEGDYTNQDILYFEGVGSCKMPVLTTTGKNLFDASKELKNFSLNHSNGLVDTKAGNRNTSDFIKVIPNTIYKCNVTMTRLVYYDKNKKYISGNITMSQPITTPTSCNFVRFSYDNALTDIQFEEGSIATPYEPYQSNIVTVNEDVTLCGIEDVKDTLDCLTGELTQRVSEIVLDGSDDENWVEGDRDENSVPFFQTVISGRKWNDKLICDKLIVRKDIAGDKIAVSTTVYGIMGTASNPVRVKNGATSLTEFKQWLSKNPITVQYELATESIKTVELLVQNQDGKTLSVIKPIEGTMYLSTSSDTIIPLFSGEVPVEAITQNLASFIDLEMEE